MIRVYDGAYRDCGGHAYRPYGPQVLAVVAANPGDLWLVGDELDCIWQDSAGLSDSSSPSPLIPS